MKVTAVLIICLLLTGCSSLILRDDDNIGHTVAKVTTRTLIALPTVFLSELFVSKAKKREALEAKLADQDAYFGSQCAKEGIEPRTQEYRGCIAVKREQMEQRMRAQ